MSLADSFALSVCVAGNKCDIPKDKWEVTEEDLADLRRSNLYYLTSAATGENLDNAFSHLTGNHLFQAKRSVLLRTILLQPKSQVKVLIGGTFQIFQFNHY